MLNPREKYVEYTTSYYIFKNIATGQETFIDSAESDKLAKTVDTEEVKGGPKNLTFFTISKNEKINIEVVDVLSREELIRARWGAELKKETGIALPQLPSIKTVKQNVGKLEFNLDQKPIDNTKVVIYDNKTGTKLEPTTDYTITEKVVEIKKSGVNNGDTFYVESYTYASESEVEFYDVGTDSVPSVYEVYRIKEIYNTNDEVVYLRTTHMPKVQLDKAIEENGQTEKTKQTTTYSGTVQKSDNYPYVMRTVYVEA